MKQIVIASNNAGKLREIAAILAPLGIKPVAQADFNVPEAEEPYPTFVENALTKARNAAHHTGMPALADDSGICVEALGGAPGVLSARYGGEPKSDERNNQKLVAALANEPNRRAYYYAALVLVRHENDPQPLIAEGVWRGEVVLEARGAGGFGYDPYFFLPAQGQTAAELAPELKNKISHRALALQRLAALLKEQPL
ncbi:MAG TPA: RdgB/HAM1 family non-canonical purine NTP pyrophosphatase [Burkholderiales bacterium]|jgi:XTP/dITP diphosphohydrolase|nr:RdgB/HAM1 family non-canonical purine NTP pyrophosphatase [Burkholderiales bacterium]